MSFFKSRSDIALIKLISPVSGVSQINIYTGTSEKGKRLQYLEKAQLEMD
jgi:hypothetical protein